MTTKQNSVFTWEQLDEACQKLVQQIRQSNLEFYGVYGTKKRKN